MKVSNVLDVKGTDVFTVRPEETINTLSHRLRALRVGAIIVSSDGSTVDGIISERDVAFGLAEHGADLLGMKVSDLMTRSVVTCTRDSSISDLMKQMTQRRIRHLPVVENGKLVGVISIGDIVKHRLAEMQTEADVMRDYAIARH
ncbi:CBS domain-containing protein [Oricola nitratireducens]|uniref:CBS domain-containing protein n=1 Tax=Oricola nitratireducens TaxID=2775868 RepID=UPI0018690EBE|nr:CBS domain-containing protein [Oricola nitratireducens]